LATRSSRKSPAINVAVIGYDPLRLVGLRALLETDAEFAIHNVATEALGQPFPGELVLMGSHGLTSVFDAIATLRTLRPQLRIILSCTYLSDEAALRAISAGVKGCVDEAAPAEEYKQALRIVHAGSMWVQRRVLAKFVERATMSPARFGGQSRLSDRELQVLELLVAGHTNREIAGELGIEERTVKSHVSKLMKKAGVDNRIALSVYAVTNAVFTRV